ncbi:MAG: tetratricopeptide repeat protein [Bacteroidales bacterium]|nr:tetratricopeptide repeat protein [Bacteroidales bacterium]
MRKSFIIAILMFAVLAPAFGQTDRKDVRHGNRLFGKENYQEAEIDYKKALMKDSLSNAANFNIGNTYYRMENYSEADRHYASVMDSLDRAGHGAQAFFNQGDSYLKQRNWQAAVEAFKNSLRRNPDDMDAKSNLAYAQKMLENQQQQGGGGQNQDQQNQNQDQNQGDNDQNQDQQNQDQNQGDNDQNQDQQSQDQNQNQNNNDQNQDQQNQQGQSGEQPKISPQAAQQMLQAIQDQEKQTQDKVRKEKAAKVKSKQKDKNW